MSDGVQKALLELAKTLDGADAMTVQHAVDLLRKQDAEIHALQTDLRQVLAGASRLAEALPVTVLARAIAKRTALEDGGNEESEA